MNKKGKYVYEWPRPMVTADAVVFTQSGEKTKVLLIKRGSEPFVGQWAVPGGFVNMDEEIEDAVVRELEEETGLTGIHLEQIHTFGTVGRDPRGRQITIVYMGIADENLAKLQAGDDAAEAKWFDINELPENLAFDHDEMVSFAIGKLKNEQ